MNELNGKGKRRHNPSTDAIIRMRYEHYMQMTTLQIAVDEASGRTCRAGPTERGVKYGDSRENWGQIGSDRVRSGGNRARAPLIGPHRSQGAPPPAPPRALPPPARGLGRAPAGAAAGPPDPHQHQAGRGQRGCGQRAAGLRAAGLRAAGLQAAQIPRRLR